MNLKYNKNLKALSQKAAKLVATLYDKSRPIFSYAEAEQILETRAATDQVLAQLLKRGVAARLKPGVFSLVPFEMGFEREYMGNPYIVARELSRSKRKIVSEHESYYISHASAFDLHQMLTQPQLVVYATVPKLVRARTVLGTEFRFVRCKKEDLFGITEMWVDKTEKVMVSDLERTLLDGLKQPNYCGGITEVAKAFSMKREIIDPKKLTLYCLRLDIGAVIRRLGYIMELYQIGTSSEWDILLEKLTATYHLLDPHLPPEGHHVARWRLRLNVSEDELRALRSN